MRFFTGLFFFLIALICSWNPQKAQASDSLPAQIQRNWAQPDCASHDDIMVLSKYFAFKADDKGMTLSPAQLIRKKQDYWVVDIGNGGRQPVQVQNDGILYVGAARTGAWPKSWDDVKQDEVSEYTGCDDAPKTVSKTMLRMMRYIDRVSEQCTLSISNECAAVLFKLTDANNDKKLTLSEIRRMADEALLLSALASGKSLTNAQAAALLKSKKGDIDTLIRQLMAACDKNRSHGIDYNELVENFKAPADPLVKTVLENIGNLIPAFKVAALALR